MAPGATAIASDGKTLYLACERSGEIAVVDLAEKKVTRRFSLPETPAGLVLANNPSRLIVTCSGKSNTVVSLDRETGRILSAWTARAGICSPVLSVDGAALYVCNRHENTVSRIDLADGRETARRKVQREPVFATLCPDGRKLAVANFLPAGVANTNVVRAAVSVLNAATLEVEREIWLPNGSTCVRAVAFRPNSRQCAAVHGIGRFQLPATQVEHGWMNVSALTLFTADENEPVATILLDEPRRGAANPWAVAWTADGRHLCIAHAGTHELSIIDVRELEAKLAGLARGAFVTDFSFLEGIQSRLALPLNGPRAFVLHEGTVYVPGFFSDSLSAVDLETGRIRFSMALATSQASDQVREGERLFNDATICHQGWQSCVSCHPDGRVDGLNWDLRNDGLGNPKNTKSLLLAHRTPPAMTSGARASAEQAVRSGLRHIHFAKRPESEAAAMDEYLRSMQPAQSPHLLNGALSGAARRGQRLFEDPRVGCADCHPAPWFTDLERHHLNRSGPGKEIGAALDTPTLAECWRTAPYLHDGSAITIEEVLTRKNPGDYHGITSHLSPQEIADLAAYVLSL
jgi:mono/diheme cytochrome c family protein